MPSGATVYVDGEKIGTTPIDNYQLLIGKHRMEIKKKDYYSVIRDIEVVRDVENKFSAELSDRVNVSFSSEPAGALLSIDGVNKGSTPQSVEMTSGTYKVKLEKDGYMRSKRTVHVSPSNNSYSVRLSKIVLSETNRYVGVNYQFGHVAGLEFCYGRIFDSNIILEGSLFKPNAEKYTVLWVGWSGKNTVEYQLANAISTQLGYGFIVLPSVRIAPRVGLLLNKIVGGERHDLEWDERTLVASGRLGVHAEYTPASFCGIVGTAMYDIPLVKGNLADQLSSNTDFIKDWCSGFSINVGVKFYFNL